MKSENIGLKSYICYSFSGAATMILCTIANSFLSVFYTDVLGITAASIAIIMLVSKIWDAVNDPMMGVIAERTRTRWGRFRPWILWMSPVLGISLVLTFFVWPGNMVVKAVLAGVGYILFGMAYTAAGIPMQSLPIVMTRDMSKRVKLYSAFGIASQIGGIVAGAVFLPMVLKFGNGKSNSGKGYLISCIIIGIVCCVLLLLSFWGTKETINPGEQGNNMSIIESLKLVAKDKNVFLLLGGMIFALIGVFGRISVVAFYYMYVLERVDLVSMFISLNSIGMLVPYFFLPQIYKKFDVKKVMAFSCVLCAAACIVLFLCNGNIPIVIAATFVLGAGNWLTLGSQTMVAQIIDDNEVRNGVRSEGILVSVISFSTKLSSAIGSAVGVPLLMLVGYIPNAVQSAEVKHGMSAVINITPALAYIIAIIFFLLINMTNKKAEENTVLLTEKNK